MSDQKIDRRQALKVAGSSAIVGAIAGCGRQPSRPSPAEVTAPQPRTPEQEKVELLRKLTEAGVEIKNIKGMEANSLDQLKQRSSLSKAELEKLASDPEVAGDFTAWGAWTLRF